MSSMAVNAAGVFAEPIGSHIPFFVFMPNQGPKLLLKVIQGLDVPALHEQSHVDCTDFHVGFASDILMVHFLIPLAMHKIFRSMVYISISFPLRCKPIPYSDGR